MVDIIIPVWNELELTKGCIESIKRCTKISYRLIIIDNGSERETKEYLDNLMNDPEINVILIRNEVNIGYIKAVNQGLRLSDAEYVCILNNDTLVTDGWLEKMVDLAESHNDIGLINPVLKGKKGDYPPEDLDGIAMKLEEKRGKYIELDHCTGTCLLIKREVINKIGFFDEIYGFGYWEDIDYSKRAQRSGYKCVCSLNSLVWHYVSRTFSKIENWKKLSEQNKKIYIERWGDEIILIYPFPENLPMERARSIQYVHTCFSLAKIGMKVYMILPGNRKNKEEILNYYGIIDHDNVSFVFLPSMRIRIANVLKITVNYIFYLSSLIYIMKRLRKIRKKDPQKKIVILTRHPKLANFLINFKNIIRAKFIYEVHEVFSRTSEKKKRRLLKIEKRIFNKYDGFITITEHLKKEISEVYSVRKPISVIRDGVNIIPWREKKNKYIRKNERIVIYTGQTYPWKGVDILIKASRYINGNVVIIGGEDKDLKMLKKMAQELGVVNIEFLGWVKPTEIEKFMDRASVGVIPLKTDTISQFYTSPLKMFEYMAAGVPIVASDLPSIREVLKNEENALIVKPEDPIELAKAVNRLLDDKELAERIAENALRDVRKYSWDERAKTIKEFILKGI